MTEESKENETETSWLSCAGMLESIIQDFSECGMLLSKLKDEDAPNPFKFLADISHIVCKTKSKCTKLLKAAEKAIDELAVQNNSNAESFVIQNNIIDHDPGKRGKVTSEGQRLYLLNLGPCQPKLMKYPINEDQNEKQKFTSKWYDEYPHLEYSIHADAAFCFVCSLFPCKDTEDHWTSIGVRTWDKMKGGRGKNKKSKLEAHFSSKAHKSSLLAMNLFINKSQHIDKMFDKTDRKESIQAEYEKNFNAEVIEILMDICRTLARQGIALRGHDNEKDGNFEQVVALMSRYVPSLKKWCQEKQFHKYATYMSGESQNEFLSLIAQEVENEILENVKKAKFFSVMADTTPDLSHKDQLSLGVRFVDSDGKISERIIDFDEIKDKTGQGFAQTIVKKITEKGLDTANIAFQSYDFAANMAGVYQGTQAKLSELVGHHIPYIPCQAHRLNIFIEHACARSLTIADLFAVLESLYEFFSSSTKRYDRLNERLMEIGNALQLKNLSKTRWAARAESIRAVWASLENIITITEEISNDTKVDTSTRSSAFALLKKLLNFDFIASLYFMKNLIFKLKLATDALQAVELNIIDAITLLDSLHENLVELRNDTTAIDDLITAAAQFAIKFDMDPEADFCRYHRSRRPPKKIDDNPQTNAVIGFKTYYRTEFIKVLDSLIVETGENLTKSFKAIEPLVKIFQLPINSNLSQEEIENVLQLLPPGVNTRNVKDYDCIISEFEVLKVQSKNSNSFSEVMAISEKMKHLLPITNNLIRLTCTAGVSTASNERSFNHLKQVKNPLRTTMTNERLKNLLVINCNKDICDMISLKKIIQKWITIKKRRVNF